MLTPRFHLDQDDSYVLVTIYAPFTNVSDTEVFMDDTDFRFFSRPYFLRLHLPGQVEETEDARAEYVADKRSFVVRVPKKNPGEHFIGLDMLTSLLTPSLGSLESSSSARAGVQEVTESLEADGSQWFFQQELPQSEEGKEEEIENLESVPGYGFGFRQRGVYSKNLESQEILNVKRPDELDFSQRRELRLEQERAAFSEDHYLCDLFETEEVDRLMSHEHDEDRLTRYSEEEQTKLVSLRKEIPVVGKADRLPVYHGLVDLLFASCYDLRANEGERSSESGWTVGKLSSMLSCNERAESLRECVVAGLRRSLCYPLHRNFGLSLKCFQDVSRVLKLGNVAVVKALTELTLVFSESDRYLFNQLYLEPYAVWAQMIPSSHFESLADALDKVLSGVSKDSLDLDLVELEEAAKLVQKEEEGKKSELCEVADSLKRLEIKAAADSDDDDNSSSSDDDNSLESSEEEESSSEEDETSSEKEVPKEHKASDDRVKDDDKESGKEV